MSEPSFAPGQVVTVFRSRLVDEPDERYDELNDQMHRRAHEFGGLVEVKTFLADDGERVTLVTFEDRASHERWASDPIHRDAQALGRSSVYAAYSVQVADCTSVAVFEAPGT